MGNLWVAESTVSHRDNGDSVRLGDGEPQESFTDDRGDLFRECVREHGRCTGKVWVDRESGPVAVGWTFVTRRPMLGPMGRPCPSGESTLIETWVTVHNGPPTRTVTYDYAVDASAKL